MTVTSAAHTRLKRPHDEPAGSGLGDAFDAARARWEIGDYQTCLDLLDQEQRYASPTQEVTLLRARALLKLNQNQQALQILREHGAQNALSDDTIEGRMLLAAALARCEDLEEGLSMLHIVHNAAIGYDRPAMIAEIEYELALANWTLRRYDESQRWALACESRHADIPSVRATALRGWILLAAEQYHDALDQFEAALEAYENAQHRDEQLRLSTVHAIAMLTANVLPNPLKQTEKRARRERTRRLERSTATHLPIVSLKIALEDSWAFAIEGDSNRAVLAARRAFDLAPTKAWRVWPLSNRAAIFRAFGEALSANDHAGAAYDLLREINWDRTSDEERFGILTTAEQMRHVDPSLALDLLAQFDEIRSPLHARVAIDSKHDAYYQFVSGSINASAGRTEDAIEQLKAAYEIYQRVGYIWRATLALIELRDAIYSHPSGSRDDARIYHDRATALITRHFANSPLRAKVGISEDDPSYKALTPAQRDVLHYFIVEGLEPIEIARTRRGAVKTIYTHLQDIYEAFGVKSAPALVAECARRGLIRHPKLPDAV